MNDVAGRLDVEARGSHGASPGKSFSDNTMKLMANDEYILDVTTELEFKRRDYFLLLKRTVWIHPLRLDNDLYIDVMFFQVGLH